MFRKFRYKILMFILSLGCTPRQDSQAQTSSISSSSMSKAPVSFYSLKATTLDGKTFEFEQLRGKKVLLVNTASECGFTPQLQELQKLHEQYGQKVTVLGFPCNQFGGQEPGSSAEIGAFCKKNYGVTFQLFEKVEVKGKSVHPVYQWLSTKAQNGKSDESPSWNFGKYLISENGEWMEFFGSGTSPISPKIVDKIVR